MTATATVAARQAGTPTSDRPPPPAPKKKLGQRTRGGADGRTERAREAGRHTTTSDKNSVKIKARQSTGAEGRADGPVDGDGEGQVEHEAEDGAGQHRHPALGLWMLVGRVGG